MPSTNNMNSKNKEAVNTNLKDLMERKFPLGFFPTPVHALKNLSGKYKDYTVYIKRDDQTGLASGGNKTRKLEYLIREALDQGCDTVITAGAQQSNHCRQTAAACNLAGLQCHLLVRGHEPVEVTGNLLLSKLLGARIHYVGEEIKPGHVETLKSQLEAEGCRPYYTPIGGSTLTGALGFVGAAGELKAQLEAMNLHIDTIFFASCSGGTQAGLVLGKSLYRLAATLMPVRIEKSGPGTPGLEETLKELVFRGKDRLNIRQDFGAGDMALVKGYDNAGYGVLTQEEKTAIHELAREEGIFLDPVYTARAFYAMSDHLQKRLIKPGSTVLFWHTGGFPANFHYGKALL